VKIQLISSTIGSFNRKNLAELALQYRLPSMFVNRQYTDAGGLMFYGANSSAIWRLLAEYVDKILKGAAPADLPIQQPTTFELVINSKTAKALGLMIPQSILVRADEVIE
jgi:putative ABC transport system substrate-binding protein